MQLGALGEAKGVDQFLSAKAKDRELTATILPPKPRDSMENGNFTAKTVGLKQSQGIPPAKLRHSTSKFRSFTRAKMVQDKNYQAKGLVSSHLRHSPMVGMKMPTSSGDGEQR